MTIQNWLHQRETMLRLVFTMREVREAFPSLSAKVVKNDLGRRAKAGRVEAVHRRVGRGALAANVEAKLADPDYLSDLDNFLAPGVSFDPASAWANVKARIVDRI